MRTGTARSRTTLRLIVAGWLLLTTGSTIGAWPITKFQIAPRPPVNAGISPEDQREEIETGPYETAGLDALWDSISGADDGQPKQREGSKPLEGGLEEIALQYSRAGFAEPYLMPVVNDDGWLKYRVYMYPGFDGLAAYNQWKCGKSEDEISRIEASSTQFPATGSISKPGYFALGHELAHAVQASSLTSNCEKRAFWITEGMANAAGQHVTLQKWPATSSGSPRPSGQACAPMIFGSTTLHPAGRKRAALPKHSATRQCPSGVSSSRASAA